VRGGASLELRVEMGAGMPPPRPCLEAPRSVVALVHWQVPVRGLRRREFLNRPASVEDPWCAGGLVEAGPGARSGWAPDPHAWRGGRLLRLLCPPWGPPRHEPTGLQPSRCFLLGRFSPADEWVSAPRGTDR
jgi:hypothetical protein